MHEQTFCWEEFYEASKNLNEEQHEFQEQVSLHQVQDQHQQQIFHQDWP